MVVIVADAILVACRRAGRLNAPDQARGGEKRQRVVHGLQRDGADLGSDDLGHVVGRDVRLTADCAKDSQSLGGHLDAALTKNAGLIRGHDLPRLHQ
jgi:hypothetical protein